MYAAFIYTDKNANAIKSTPHAKTIWQIKVTVWKTV